MRGLDVWNINFPHWSLAILFAIAPTYWFFGLHRRRTNRLKLGLSPACGYDLREHVGAVSERGTPSTGSTPSTSSGQASSPQASSEEAEPMQNAE